MINGTRHRGAQALTADSMRAFEIFQDTDVQTRTEIVQLMTVSTFEKGAIIIGQDQEHDEVYFILQGRVRAALVASNGKEVQFEDLGAGMMFGELNALDHQGRSSNCYCLDSTTVARLSAADFERQIEQHPPLARAVMQRLTRMVRRQMNRVFEYSTTSVSARIRQELIRLAHEADCFFGTVDFNTVPTHNEIAERISTHREAVTRELKILERAGYITWKRSRHTIHDLQSLQETLHDNPAEASSARVASLAEAGMANSASPTSTTSASAPDSRQPATDSGHS